MHYERWRTIRRGQLMKAFFENKIVKAILLLIKILLIIVIGVYLSFILLQRLSGNNSVFGYRLFTIATGSMTGVYNVDDVIAVKDYDINKLKVGDDIAYMGGQEVFGGKLITHRIIEIEKNENGEKSFHTKGVNSTIEDPIITGDQILGKVVGKVPIITNINHIIKSQRGFFLLIFCPIILITILEILKTMTDLKIDKKKEIINDNVEEQNSIKEII